ncbi:MAG: penicillin acylase family protein [Planctomycetes bacterium]|nr:penicillin acylase family protein [Planctomycetota bacterium]
MDRISTKSAQVDFQAVRDEAGVAHIEAGSWHDALYALGYLHAIDRPTQIFFSRVVAQGEAAARIANKPELVETDRFFRRAGLHLDLDNEVENLRPQTREQLDCYCNGVNDGLQESGRTLPMWVTGFRPRPWQPTAVLAIGNLLSFAGLAVVAQENERLLLELIQAGVRPELLRELMSPYLDHVDFEPLLDIRIERRLSDEALEMLADLPRLAGSNAWAVAPRRSATGHALLASDPHLEVNRLPAIWYEAALHWPGEKDSVYSEADDNYVMGATLPGCPLMAVGRSRQLAWGVTYLHADTSDYFVEDCRPGGATGWQYRREEHWHDFLLREEVIECKNAQPSTMQVFENEQGTVLWDLTDQEPGKYLSAAWIGSHAGAGRSIGCWLDVMQCDDTKQAMDVVRENPHPTLVWVFADADGHIGRQASGWLPQRPEGQVGIVPALAWDESTHWQGRLDDDLLPGLYDPAEGYLASANENLDRAGEFYLHSHALAGYRKQRIVERLHELEQVTLEDMQQLQYDVTSLQARRLLPIFLPHTPDGPLKETLTDWDLRYHPESTAATAFQHLYRHVVLEIFGHEEGIGWRRMLFLCTRMGYSSMILTAIDDLLCRPDSLWWQSRDKGELIRIAAERAAEEPIAPWGEINAFHFTNRFFEGSRVGKLLGFRSERKAMPGCQATPFQGHLLATATRESSFAPSYHLVTDLGTQEAWTNLPGGASESRFSKWYRNDIARWLAGDFKRLLPQVENEGEG